MKKLHSNEWSLQYMLYQHTFTAEREAVDDKIDSFFNDIIDSFNDTKK